MSDARLSYANAYHVMGSTCHELTDAVKQSVARPERSRRVGVPPPDSFTPQAYARKQAGSGFPLQVLAALVPQAAVGFPLQSVTRSTRNPDT